MIKHLERNHQYTARENKKPQEIIDKVLQKAEFTRDQLLDGIKTLGSNELHISKTIDFLEKGLMIITSRLEKYIEYQIRLGICD